MPSKETATNADVDAYLARAKTWQAEQEQLRRIALDCALTEDFKWGQPCYSWEGSNIVLIHVFKAYAALLFFKGALMKDPEGILVQQTKNVQAARQIRFTAGQDIAKMKTVLKAYIREAIAVEKSGQKVSFKETAAFEMPEEFRARLAASPEFKAAFEALTPGRQRAYLLHFAAAKQSGTREARIEKCRPKILAGKGLNDE